MEVQLITDSDYRLHIHKAGCRDVARTAARSQYESIGSDHVYNFASVREVIEDWFSDFIFSNDKQPWTDYRVETIVAPCAKDLPES